MRHNTTLLDEMALSSGLYDMLSTARENDGINVEYLAGLTADTKNILNDIEEGWENKGSFWFDESENRFFLKEEEMSFQEIPVTEKPVCRSVIAEIEGFLRGKKLTGAEVKRLNDEYKLRKFNGMYQCRKKTAYKILCQKYENASLYRSWDDLYYGMMDGRKEWELPWNKAV